MSKKQLSHLRGERGQAFAELIRGVPAEQILCVSLDISKYFHVAMIHNGLGEIVTPPFDVNIYRSGFDQLCQMIDQAKSRSQAQVLLVGMEPTSHYFENLARHLLKRSDPVKLINSYAVKQNREQQLMRREKSDQIDVAAIGDLLRRGEGTPYRPVSGIYLQIQQLDRVRQGKVKIANMLKNQMIGHLDRIFPGLVLVDEGARDILPTELPHLSRSERQQNVRLACQVKIKEDSDYRGSANSGAIQTSSSQILLFGGVAWEKGETEEALNVSLTFETFEYAVKKRDFVRQKDRARAIIATGYMGATYCVQDKVYCFTAAGEKEEGIGAYMYDPGLKRWKVTFFIVKQ